MKYRKTIIAVLIGIALGFYFRDPKNGTKSQGFVQKKFERIRKIFDQILKYEKEGLTVAVYKDNELVADLWGGYAEKNAYRLWEKDTLTLGFSTTKAIGAFIVAILVSRKQVQYEDKITKFWPEFGKHGKENVTVQWLLEHKAGLIKLDGELDLSRGNDYKYISKLIEETKPRWPPGTQTGYHAITFGWLVDQVVRRVDPKKRGAADFYREEIHPLMKDKDYYIGLPRSEQYRVARVVQPTFREFLKAILTNSFYMRFVWYNLLDGFSPLEYMGYMEISGGSPPWFTVVRWEMPYNNPAVLGVENCAVTGIGTARGLASAVAAIMQNNLISKEVWERISKPTEYVLDKVAKIKAYRGHGFFYDPHPLRKESFLMMHTGHGRQKLTIDPVSKVVAVLLRNGLSWHIGTDAWTDLITKNVLVAIDRS